MVRGKMEINRWVSSQFFEYWGFRVREKVVSVNSWIRALLKECLLKLDSHVHFSDWLTDMTPFVTCKTTCLTYLHLWINVRDPFSHWLVPVLLAFLFVLHAPVDDASVRQKNAFLFQWMSCIFFSGYHCSLRKEPTFTARSVNLKTSRLE